VKGFKDGMKTGDEAANAANAAKEADAPAQQLGGTTIEGEIKKEKTS